VISLTYPQNGFSKEGLKIIKNKTPFKIEFTNNLKWNTFIEGHVFFLEKESSEKISFLTMIKLFTVLFSLLLVHFYALSAGYKLETVDKLKREIFYKYSP
jgi:hypothetical protein